MNLILPPQSFFSPTAEWWTFVASVPWLKWKSFHDVGAGMGSLTESMRNAGYDCKGIDICKREGQSSLVEIGDVFEKNFTMDDCLLVARPCHGSFPVRLWDSFGGDADILYIGLERNVSSDMGDGDTVYYKMADNVGEDGENVYRVIGTRSRCQKWCLLETDFWNRACWMQDGGSRWVNPDGGGFDKDKSSRVLDTQWFMHSYQIRYQKEDICSTNPKEDNGWIAPDGEWFPGGSAMHAVIMSDVLGITEARAELVGFVRCYGRADVFYTHDVCHIPTSEQLKVLRRFKYTIRDYEKLRLTD